MVKICIHKIIFSLLVMIVLVGIKSYASLVYQSFTTETTETTEVVPIIEEKKNLVGSVFSHKEPDYSEVIKKIKNSIIDSDRNYNSNLKRSNSNEHHYGIIKLIPM